MVHGNKINELPDGKYVIGFKSVLRDEKIKEVVVAENCPLNLRERLEEKGIKINIFNGNQKQLGIKLGKPFFVAVVGVRK